MLPGHSLNEPIHNFSLLVTLISMVKQTLGKTALLIWLNFSINICKRRNKKVKLIELFPLMHLTFIEVSLFNFSKS